MGRRNEPIGRLEGCWVALPTFFNSQGNLDWHKMTMLLDDLVASGAEGIVVGGTTGQASLMTPEERVNLVERVFEYLNWKAPIIAGAGGPNPAICTQIIDEVQSAIGPTTFLVDGGHGLKLGDDPFEQHYRVIAEHFRRGSNGVVYNNPGRTSSNVSARLTYRLARSGKWVGEKEASGDLNQVERKISWLLKDDVDSYTVVSGEDDQVAEIGLIGGRGVISATAAIAPRLFRQLTDATLEHRYDDAARLQERISGPKSTDRKSNSNYKGIWQAVFPPIAIEGRVFGRHPNPITLNNIFRARCRVPLDVDITGSELERYVEDVLSLYTNEEILDLRKYKKSSKPS